MALARYSRRCLFRCELIISGWSSCLFKGTHFRKTFYILCRVLWKTRSWSRSFSLCIETLTISLMDMLSYVHSFESHSLEFIVWIIQQKSKLRICAHLHGCETHPITSIRMDIQRLLVHLQQMNRLTYYYSYYWLELLLLKLPLRNFDFMIFDFEKI